MAGARRSLSQARPRTRLIPSSNRRYLQNTYGEPFLVHGDTAWSLFNALTPSEVEDYLDDCQARGFNALVADLMAHEFTDTPPENYNGDLPFTGTAFQSTLTSAYWNHVVSVVQQAKQRGIVIFASVCYSGFPSTEEGWDTEIAAASQGQVESYAQAVAGYLSAEPNLVWVVGGDQNLSGTLLTRTNQMAAALLVADPKHTLISAHFQEGTSSYNAAQSYFTFHLCYSDNSSGLWPQLECRGGWEDSAKPVILYEGIYEDVTGGERTPLDARRQAWTSFLSGACGHFYGHSDIWGFGHALSQVGTWQDAVANVGGVATGRTQMAHLRSFMLARPWHLLAPDFPAAATFVTAGRGTENSSSYVPAALASDDSWGAAYLPTGSSGGAITVDRSEFSGAFSWTWYNPRTGGTSGGASGVSNSGTDNYTAPDTNDWVWVGEVD